MALTKVGKGGLGKGTIKDQTNLNAQAADSDEYLLYDASTDTLKSIAASNVTPNETLITGKTELALADLTTADLLLIYDASAGVLKKIQKGSLVASQPTVSSVSPTNALSGDGTGNYTFVISGSSFETPDAVKFIGNDGTEYTASSTTEDSATQITAVVAKSTLPVDNEPYDIKVTNNNGLTTTKDDAFNIDAQPAFSTSAGSLGTFANADRSGISVSAVAADPESGGDITYTLESGSIPAGLSLTSTSSGAVISGDATLVGSNTTSTFTIRAADVNSNISDRQFSITINAPIISSFTSSGTFAVPSGVTAVDVLVVAGGGSGGLQHGSGGGAGGLIYRPGFPVTPSSNVSVTVGNGGGSGTSASNVTAGQDSIFGTLAAKGGGRGTVGNDSSGGPQNGTSGGSGAGGGYQANSTASSATQPNQSGDSGNYGFGNPGGQGGGPGDAGGGGGGAGGAGENAGTDGNGYGGEGGVGRAYTIADGTTSVYYAGGGGGGAHSSLPAAAGTGGQGGGGNAGIYGPALRAQPGTANRGGGGGGEGAAISQHATANAGGGKGIVIVSY